jgi:hypothetical protein
VLERCHANFACFQAVECVSVGSPVASWCGRLNLAPPAGRVNGKPSGFTVSQDQDQAETHQEDLRLIQL